MGDSVTLIYGFKVPGSGLNYKCSHDRFIDMTEENIGVIYNSDTCSYYIGIEFIANIGYEEVIGLAKIHNKENIKAMKNLMSEVYDIKLDESAEPCLYVMIEL